MQVAHFHGGQQQAVVSVAGVLAQPGVEGVKVGVAGLEVGRDAAKELGPENAVLQGVDAVQRDAGAHGRRLRPEAEPVVACVTNAAAQVLAQFGWQAEVEGAIGVALVQHEGVEAGVEHVRLHENARAIDGGVLAGIHKGDASAVGVEPHGQDVAAHRVGLDGFDFVGVGVEVFDGTEADACHERVAGGERERQVLVEFGVFDVKVRLQRVDAFEADAGDAGLVEAGHAVGSGQALDQLRIVGLELDGVAIGLGAAERDVRVVDVKTAFDERVGHVRRLPGVGRREVAPYFQGSWPACEWHC